jgi:methylated-DNA-[protein]-cysteine S-methyltransferase
MTTVDGSALRTTTISSPVGPLLLVGDGEALRGVYMSGQRRSPQIGGMPSDGGGILADAASQLDAYFAGERTRFDLALELDGSPFQTQVWGALTSIPYGRTATYGELAAQIGRAGAARAIGHANARNPISIVVPCHRVIGASGALTGYAGGVDRKHQLLQHEQAVLAKGSSYKGSSYKGSGYKGSTWQT